MAAEAVAKTPGVGSESRDCFDVSEEKLSFKDKELEERGEHAAKAKAVDPHSTF